VKNRKRRKTGGKRIVRKSVLVLVTQLTTTLQATKC